MAVSMDLVQAENIKEDWVPIGEIARVTGINTVTLRAWERRFGLLKPKRTQKGHRLYSQADLIMVQEIQKWLGRGLAISKVSSLLKNQLSAAEFVDTDSEWLLLQNQLAVYINDFQRAPLQRQLEDLFALYPAELLADKLLLPLLSRFTDEALGRNARAAYWENILSQQLAFSLAKLAQVSAPKKVLILGSSAQESQIPGLLFSCAASVNGCAGEYLHFLPKEEALVAANAMGAGLVVILGYQILELANLRVFLDFWVEKTQVPIMLLGPIAVAYQALTTELTRQVYMAESHMDAVIHLKKIFNENTGIDQ